MTAVAAGDRYAGLVTRSVAFVIDTLIINAVAIAVAVGVGLVLDVLIPGGIHADLPTIVAGSTLWITWVIGYFVAFWTLLAQTPGMWLMHLAVTTVDGRRIGVLRSVRRLVGLALAALPLGAGFLLILFNRRRQGLQDKIAGTVVVYASAGIPSAPRFSRS